MHKNRIWIGFQVLCFALTCMAHDAATQEAETRAILNAVLETEYCGTAVQNGLGVDTAIRGLSPVPGRGFVRIEEADWGPMLLEMAANELDRCKIATVGLLTELRQAEKTFADIRPLLKTPEARGNASAPIVNARHKLRLETKRLHAMLTLMWQMEGEREEVVRMIGRIARECPTEFEINTGANGAWLSQTKKDGDMEKCLELGKWYRTEKGKGCAEEVDFCCRLVAEVLPNCASDEGYGMAVRYVLDTMDGCEDYGQCRRFDDAAVDCLPGWVGSVQRRRMAERFADWKPQRFNPETGALERVEPTPAERAYMLTTHAAAELAAKEKDLTDLREVYGSWGEDNAGDTNSPLTEP